MILIFILAELLEVLRHAYLIRVKKQSPDKLLSLVIRCVVAAIILSFESRNLPQAMFLYFLVGFWLHDYALIALLKYRGTEGYADRPLWYLNGTGPIDRLQRYTFGDFAWFFWKTLLFLGALGIYWLN